MNQRRDGFRSMYQPRQEAGFTLMSDFIGEMVLLKGADPLHPGRAGIQRGDFPAIGRQFGVEMTAEEGGPITFTCKICGDLVASAQCIRVKHEAYYDRLEEENANKGYQHVELEPGRRRSRG